MLRVSEGYESRILRIPIIRKGESPQQGFYLSYPKILDPKFLETTNISLICTLL